MTLPQSATAPRQIADLERDGYAAIPAVLEHGDIDRLLLALNDAIERFGARLSPGFSGVIVVEASKELIAPIGKAARARSLRDFVPVRIGGHAREDIHGCNAPASDD